MKILIVDDDQINSKILAKRLEKKGFSVLINSSGEECLQTIAKDNSISLILLDVMMPGLSGIDVLEKIRETKPMSELPIIMATSKSDTTDIVVALKKGANDYITKPVNMDMAFARIETQLHLRQLNIDSLRNRELQTLNAMIVTYNHKINNPLTIAICGLQKYLKSKDESALEKVGIALDRITDIVKKIDSIVVNEEQLSLDEYSTGKPMAKLK